jgi:hypothetical protein
MNRYADYLIIDHNRAFIRLSNSSTMEAISNDALLQQLNVVRCICITSDMQCLQNILCHATNVLVIMQVKLKMQLGPISWLELTQRFDKTEHSSWP